VSDRASLDPEVVAEQAYLDGVYERLDAMRRSAERVAEAYADVQAGGTHQARLERDIAVETTHRRLAALDVGDAPLVFGRLDEQDGTRFYVGRIAVDDDDRTPLVVDWRAPVAEPFYRATPVEPMGVLRRRHLLTRKGREVTGLDDEVFDAEASDAAGLRVVGEGALLAALERNRTGRMGDIVATIQAEQDEAVRADLPGPLIVSGGPGTGKTAVALHRAAYLLYTHRRRLAGNGVLLVGPSPVFLRYIEQVLPSLGEHDVALTTVAGLKPQLDVRASDPPALAALKGDARMVRVLRGALRDRERPPRADFGLTIDGLRLRLSRRDCRRILERARRGRGTHNARRPLVERALVDKLVGAYRSAMARSQRDLAPMVDDPGEYDAAAAAALARGEAPSPEWEQDLRRRVRRHRDVRILLERIWPVLTGAELVHDLLGFAGLIRSAAGGILGAAEQTMLLRSRAADLRDVAWTEADLALVDEADALVGPIEAARPSRRRRRGPGREAVATASDVVRELGLGAYTTGAELARRYGEAPAGEDGRGEPRTFGHVLVDEAQDLSPMQWRMIARRSPNGSTTLVGDFGQASAPGAARDWDEVLSHLRTHDEPRHVTLTVNYRTPAEIMGVANRLLAVAAPDVAPTRSVRSSGRAPVFARVGDLVPAATEAARRAIDAGGTVAVIAPPRLHAPLTSALADVGAVADAPEALDAAVGILDATAAKGLEFDHVVVVEPAELVVPDRRGMRLLYVTLTRATQTLHVVHAQPLPEALVG